jgi:diguanylate cyclase (GGDEF)-like protein
MSRHSAPSITELNAIADAVAQAADRQAAFENLIVQLTDVLRTRACVLRRADRGWILVSQTRGGLDITVEDLQRAVDTMSRDGSIDPVSVRSIGESTWTAISLHDIDEPIAILLAGDWTQPERALHPLTKLLSLAFSAVRDRTQRQAAERSMIDGFALARRLSRPAGLEGVHGIARRVVDQTSRSLNADRVALALYDPGEDRLVIVAAKGSPPAVEGSRIEAGSWLIGHVYSRGRPVVVPDVRQIPGMAMIQREYCTSSFAAVPLVAGSRTIGVLTATDKRNGSAFDRSDMLTMRMFAASATLALMAAQNGQEIQRLTDVATVDPLTGLFNRNYFDARLEQEIERARRHATTLALLKADIDNFESVNATHGRRLGDAVLQAVGSTLRSGLRVFDVCARFGSDEYAILMPGIDQHTAGRCAERIQQSVGECDLRSDGVPPSLRVTLCIGATVMGPGETSTDLLRRADQALGHARAEGKNRFHVNSAFVHARQPAIRSAPIEPA